MTIKDPKPANQIQRGLTTLKERDLYSLSLFCLYKLIGTNEYSSLSELAYILDKDSLLSLCEYFGGQTIYIPTIDEMESLVYSLLLYHYVKIESMDYDEAIKLIGHESKDLRAVKSGYLKLCEVLKNYSFGRGEESL